MQSHSRYFDTKGDVLLWFMMVFITGPSSRPRATEADQKSPFPLESGCNPLSDFQNHLLLFQDQAILRSQALQLDGGKSLFSFLGVGGDWEGIGNATVWACPPLTCEPLEGRAWVPHPIPNS